jgi:hypothetical protein
MSPQGIKNGASSPKESARAASGVKEAYRRKETSETLAPPDGKSGPVGRFPMA